MANPCLAALGRSTIIRPMPDALRKRPKRHARPVGGVEERGSSLGGMGLQIGKRRESGGHAVANLSSGSMASASSRSPAVRSRVFVGGCEARRP